MAKHGSIGEFDGDRETWKSYTERLTQYFTANDVESAAKQRAILLSVCGPTTYLADQLEYTAPKDFGSGRALIKDVTSVDIFINDWLLIYSSTSMNSSKIRPHQLARLVAIWCATQSFILFCTYSSTTPLFVCVSQW